MKTYKIVWALLMLVATAPTMAQSERTHTVRADETLFCLAGEYLGNPWRWPELLARNPHVASPETLEIGDRLTLPESARYPAGPEFICQPRWIAQGWRAAPTAEPGPPARENRPDRHLSLTLDADLHAKPERAPTAQPEVAFVSAADPVTTPAAAHRAAGKTFIRPAAGGAFYIVSGGQLAESSTRSEIALGRTIVVDRTLVD